MGGTYRIVLFDIDETLVSTQGRGTVAWRLIFQRSTGYRPTSVGTPAHAAGCATIRVPTGRYDAALRREVGADCVVSTIGEELPLR